jgi:hypothetical protein
MPAILFHSKDFVSEMLRIFLDTLHPRFYQDLRLVLLISHGSAAFAASQIPVPESQP